MYRMMTLITIVSGLPAIGSCDERFVTIQKVVGNRITFVSGIGGRVRGAARDEAAAQDEANQLSAARGRGRRGGRGPRGGRGRSGGSANQPVTMAVPVDAKITSAMRERRTFEFRVGVQLAGGLRHAVFTSMQQPLPARIVTQGSRITEINVITEDTDINQLNTGSSGETVIAVRPKRPPSR